MLYHQGQRNYECPKCNNKFYQMEHLKRHLTSIHKLNIPQIGRGNRLFSSDILKRVRKQFYGEPTFLFRKTEEKFNSFVFVEHGCATMPKAISDVILCKNRRTDCNTNILCFLPENRFTNPRTICFQSYVCKPGFIKTS